MKTFSKALITTGLLSLLSTSALASIDSVKKLNEGSRVTVSGTVDDVKNEREFTLRDQTGTIDVDIQSNQSVVLKEGDNVTVQGSLSKGILNADIDASAVTVNKNVANAISDAIESRTSASFEGATSYDINNLPKEGLVKISGTVTDVDNEKEFTLRDMTGSITIDIKSAEAAALTEGAEVTVIGYVDSGILGKDIDARKVLVVSSASPVARSQ